MVESPFPLLFWEWVMMEKVLTTLYTAGISGVTLWTGASLEDAPVVPRHVLQQGSVAVIVPARNEERYVTRNVGALLTAAAQYGDARVIVVDDGSTDDTPYLLLMLQTDHPNGQLLEIVRLDEALPSDWFGKPRACWKGAHHPYAQQADWLLFVDADTEAFPDAIGRLVAGAVESKADLYSVLTAQQLGSVAERLMMPHIFYALAVTFNYKTVNDPNSNLAIANGQCMMFRRAVYFAVGGHASVRTEIAEDRAIADRTKRHRYRLYLEDGRDIMTTRMYTNLGELWEGWTKNAYLGLGERAWILLVIAILGVVAGIVPFIALPLVLVKRRWYETFCWAATVAVLLQNRDRAMREFGVPRWYAFTLPVGAAMCCALAFSAWWRVASGQGVTWKGRRYAEKG